MAVAVDIGGVAEYGIIVDSAIHTDVNWLLLHMEMHFINGTTLWIDNDKFPATFNYLIYETNIVRDFGVLCALHVYVEWDSASHTRSIKQWKCTISHKNVILSFPSFCFFFFFVAINAKDEFYVHLKP